jgi:uncharacterized protein
MDAVKHISRLKEILGSIPGLAVAVSGGMDSTFLALVAGSVLGKRMMAVSVRSQFSIRRELEAFTELARKAGIRHDSIELNILAVPDIVRNGKDRCYHCKKTICARILDHAVKAGFGTVADGSNVSDTREHRPGRKALEELGVISPLLLAGFTKELILEAAGHLGIEIPFRHPNSCLATRIEQGTEIRPELLEMIDAGEEALRGMGFDPVRVRCHGGMARVELPIESVKTLINDDERRTEITRALKAAGFSRVTVDIEGFRPGGTEAT